MSTEDVVYVLTERDLYILTSRMDGQTFRQIARVVKLTAESVRLIYNKTLSNYPELKKYSSSKIKELVHTI